MATYTKTVDPNGGSNYASLNAWEAGEQTLYVSGDIAIADCKRTGAAKDTTAVAVAGWTSGVIPKIIVNAAHRHEGRWADQQSGGNYIYILDFAIITTSVTAISLSVSGTSCSGLLIKGSIPNANDKNFTGVTIGANAVLAYGNIISLRQNHTYGSATGINCGNGGGSFTASVINNIVFSEKVGANKTTGIVVTGDSYGTYNILNNTVFGCGQIGIIRSFKTVIAKNNAVLDTPTCFSGVFDIASDYNVSSDATAPGTNKATGKTAYTDYFVDPSNGDFHLKGTSLALFGLSGADLSGTFTTDIDGATRVAPWDIGADQYVASGGYSDALADIATANTELTDVATYLDAGTAMITAGASVADTVQLIDSLLTAVSAVTSVNYAVAQAETLLSSIQAVASVADAQGLVNGLADTVISTVTTSAIQAAAETLITTVTVSATVSDVISAVEAFYDAATAEVTVADDLVSGLGEHLSTVAAAITSATDMQLMVDNLNIMVQSSVGLVEVAAYVEQLATRATVSASVIDILVGQFVGTYIRLDYCTPRSRQDLATARSFTDTAQPRRYADLCTPRGHA